MPTATADNRLWFRVNCGRMITIGVEIEALRTTYDIDHRLRDCFPSAGIKRKPQFPYDGEGRHQVSGISTGTRKRSFIRLRAWITTVHAAASQAVAEFRAWQTIAPQIKKTPCGLQVESRFVCVSVGCGPLHSLLLSLRGQVTAQAPLPPAVGGDHSNRASTARVQPGSAGSASVTSPRRYTAGCSGPEARDTNTRSCFSTSASQTTRVPAAK